ncbi:uncharacterized protein PAC_06157 [Phialocephala subalpina]|uniref:Clr5 domain-containing protein n=1 Tax=Phialocephala subalpina TaxID=576137 RepID=A0A1L7WU28_9HELO|nr:uncharacterized protein PAC_06157 [Phialocephala subalpina]
MSSNAFEAGEVPATISSQPRQLTALERNNQKWESHKNEIRSVYIDHDKTLKETMQWFERERNFKKSKRKWKDKIKEWKFEKNAPVKEMEFMAAKAEKRKLEDKKDTEFRRHGILVDGGKIEQFKKRRVQGSDFNSNFVPGTPSQVTYSTPQPPVSPPELSPILEDDDPLAELVEYVRPANTQQTNVDGTHWAGTPNLWAKKPVFRTRNLDSDKQEEEDQTPPGIQTVIPSPEGFNFARRMRENKESQREDVEIRYIDTIRQYTDNFGTPHITALDGYLKEVLLYLVACTDDDIPMSTSQCLKLWEVLWSFPADPVRDSNHLIGSTLCDLLRRHRFLRPTESLYRAIKGLHLKDSRDPMRVALLSELNRVQLEMFLRTSTFHERRLRLLIIAFAWDLEEYFKTGQCTDLKSNIQEIISTELIDGGEDRQGAVFGFEKLQSSLLSISAFDDLDRAFVYHESERYDNIFEAATLLASACSAAEWCAVSEALFSVLCDCRIAIALHDRSHMLLEYCAYFRRKQHWTELITALLLTYRQVIEVKNSVSLAPEELAGLRQLLLFVRGGLSTVPLPIEQHVSPPVAQEIMKLDEELRRLTMVRSDTSNTQNLERVESGGEDEEMDDCKSSNKYGVTYTESVVTGISWNYSDLYK